MKTQKGVTLIALVVTIVVLLILAATTISLLGGENGILTKAKESREKTEIAGEKEKINLAVMAVKAGHEGGGVNSTTLKPELDKNIGEGKYIMLPNGDGTEIKITYVSSQRSYTVNTDGNIIGEDNNGEIADDLENLQNKYNELLKENEALKKELEELKKQNEQLQEANKNLQDTIDRLTGGNSQLEELQKAKAELEKQLAELQAKYDTLLQTNKELQDKIAQLEKEKADLTASNEQLQEQLRDLQTKYTELSTLNKTLQNQLSSLQESYNKLNETNKQLQNQVNSLTEENNTLKQEKAELQEQLGNLQEQYDALNKTNEEIRKQLEELQNNYNDLNSQNIDLQNQLNNINKILAQTNATADQILNGYKAYSAGQLLTGTMANRGELQWDEVKANGGRVPAGYYSGGDLSQVEEIIYKSLYGAGTKRYSYTGFRKGWNNSAFGGSDSKGEATVTYTVPIAHLPDDENTPCMINMLAATITSGLNRATGQISFTATTDTGLELYKTTISNKTENISLNLFAYDIKDAESITFTISGWFHPGDFYGEIEAKDIYVDYLIPAK